MTCCGPATSPWALMPYALVPWLQFLNVGPGVRHDHPEHPVPVRAQTYPADNLPRS